MRKHRNPLRSGTEEQVEQWLAWLAIQMRQQNQSEFYLEQMQADWLIDQRMRKKYLLSIVLLFALLFGLPSVPLGMLIAQLFHYTPVSGLTRGLLLIGLPGMMFG